MDGLFAVVSNSKGMQSCNTLNMALLELASKCFPQITPLTPIVRLPEIGGKSDAFTEIPVITHAFQSIFDATTACINRTLMETFDALEALIRKSAVDEKELKLALRFRVIRDMADIWKPVSVKEQVYHFPVPLKVMTIL